MKNRVMTKQEVAIAGSFIERSIVNGLYGQYYTEDKSFDGSNMIMDMDLKTFEAKNPGVDYCYAFLSYFDNIAGMVDIEDIEDVDTNICIGVAERRTRHRAGFVTIDFYDTTKSRVELFSKGIRVDSDSEEYDKLWCWLFNKLESLLI